MTRPAADLLVREPSGFACPAGGFAIDPWSPVAQAILTHAHGDHARPGCGEYLATRESLAILRRRLGPDANLRALEYGERVALGEVAVSLHPAGHVLGSAQVRVEREDEVWVVSGDYKREADPTCAPFEVVAADVFVTEATFALPIFRWPESARVIADVAAWHAENAAAGRPTLLFCYALGKAQRILAALAPVLDRPVLVHGAIAAMAEDYVEAGVSLPPLERLVESERRRAIAGDLVLAPPSARGTPWMRRAGNAATAFASGWMQIRGARRRRALDRGFVLSDHADWPALLSTIAATGARRVIVTHGFAEPLARALRERGLEAEAVPTGWEGEAPR